MKKDKFLSPKSMWKALLFIAFLPWIVLNGLGVFRLFEGAYAVVAAGPGARVLSGVVYKSLYQEFIGSGITAAILIFAMLFLIIGNRMASGWKIAILSASPLLIPNVWGVVSCGVYFIPYVLLSLLVVLAGIVGISLSESKKQGALGMQIVVVSSVAFLTGTNAVRCLGESIVPKMSTPIPQLDRWPLDMVKLMTSHHYYNMGFILGVPAVLILWVVALRKQWNAGTPARSLKGVLSTQFLWFGIALFSFLQSFHAEWFRTEVAMRDNDTLYEIEDFEPIPYGSGFCRYVSSSALYLRKNGELKELLFSSDSRVNVWGYEYKTNLKTVNDLRGYDFSNRRYLSQKCEPGHIEPLAVTVDGRCTNEALMTLFRKATTANRNILLLKGACSGVESRKQDAPWYTSRLSLAYVKNTAASRIIVLKATDKERVARFSAKKVLDLTKDRSVDIMNVIQTYQADEQSGNQASPVFLL